MVDLRISKIYFFDILFQYLFSLQHTPHWARFTFESPLKLLLGVVTKAYHQNVGLLKNYRTLENSERKRRILNKQNAIYIISFIFKPNRFVNVPAKSQLDEDGITEDKQWIADGNEWTRRGVIFSVNVFQLKLGGACALVCMFLSINTCVYTCVCIHTHCQCNKKCHNESLWESEYWHT